ncbi:MAG TPA: hypothetical protein VES20_15555 [Bryobacteraceae bacterium]|nr:hypothetical protein [Bryobacteraceae bacterium]
MSYLDDYGIRDARREKLRKWLILGLLGIVIASAALWWFVLRDRAEKQQVAAFLDQLRGGDYKGAYALWGCTDANPCPSYPFDKFLEDWGPRSPQAQAAAARVVTTKSCDTGVIQFVEYPDKHQVQLWVERSDRTIGFAPWPICNPRMKVP